MKRIAILTQVLLTIGLTFCQICLAEQQGNSSKAAAPITQQINSPRYLAYYFHGNRRCRTCQAIEANAENVIRQSFARELTAGILGWRTVNIDETNNKHFISDFNLYSSSLVLVDTATTPQIRSVNLDKVWPLAHKQEAFNTYVIEETRKFIGTTNE